MKKLLLLGSTGFVGGHLLTDLCKTYEVSSTSVRLRDVAEWRSLGEYDVVLNAAGVTGHPNVDWCESYVAETFQTNTVDAIALGVACHKRGVKLVHIGSGCIFFGQDFVSEFNYPNPRTVYTKSKYAADLALESMGHAIARIRMPIVSYHHPKNYITKVRAYEKVVDARATVTFLDELHLVIDRIIERDARGVFHAVNPEPISVARLASPGAELISEEKLRELTVCERSHSIVESQRVFEELGVVLESAPEKLERVLAEYDRKAA